MNISHRPIMLWMTSRSRSSMISAIFAAHDIYWGNKQKTTHGYKVFENLDATKLQNIYNKLWGRPYKQPVCANPKIFEKFQNELKATIPANRPWVVKTGIEYFSAFESLNPYNVFIVRNPEDVAQSLCDKRPDGDFNIALEAIKWRYNYMNEIQKQNGGVFVDTDKTIAGDFDDIQKALQYCDINYDKEKTKNAIRK